MAWFEPPLYKPGNKRCPICGHPEGWRRFWHGNWWDEWNCSGCQSVLVYDRGRRAALLAMWFALIVGWSAIRVFTHFWEPLHSLGWFRFVIPASAEGAALLFQIWWFESFKLKATTERLCDKCGCRLAPGFNTCKWCGAEVKQAS